MERQESGSERALLLDLLRDRDAVERAPHEAAARVLLDTWRDRERLYDEVIARDRMLRRVARILSRQTGSRADQAWQVRDAVMRERQQWKDERADLEMREEGFKIALEAKNEQIARLQARVEATEARLAANDMSNATPVEVRRRKKGERLLDGLSSPVVVYQSTGVHIGAAIYVQGEDGEPRILCGTMDGRLSIVHEWGDQPYHTTELAVPGGDGKGIWTMSPSGDGRCVLVGGGSSEVRLVHMDTMAISGTLSGHYGAVPGCTFIGGSSTGQAATGGVDRVIKLWDLQRGWCVRTLSGESQVTQLLGHSHGDMIFSSLHRDGRMRLWDGRMSEAALSMRVTKGGLVRGCTSASQHFILALDTLSQVRMVDVRSNGAQTVCVYSDPSGAFQPASPACSVVFARGEQVVAVGTRDGRVCWWKASDATHPTMTRGGWGAGDHPAHALVSVGGRVMASALGSMFDVDFD